MELQELRVRPDGDTGHDRPCPSVQDRYVGRLFVGRQDVPTVSRDDDAPGIRTPDGNLPDDLQTLQVNDADAALLIRDIGHVGGNVPRTRKGTPSGKGPQDDSEDNP
jgi:hypothetical protein